MSEAPPPPDAAAPSSLHRRRPWWAWLAGSACALVLGLIFLVVWLTVWPMLGIGARTLGTIYVDSPQVYTRERLVNDRFRQEAWLVQQLNRTEKLMDEGSFDGIEGRRVLNITRILNATAGRNAEQSPEDFLSTAKEATRNDGPALSAAPIEAFHEAQTYRDVVRTELMSTQLDDRHDIEGNTLYRLNFDAAIAPGNNTTAAAVVVVTLEEEWTKQNYMNLYADWHAHLQAEIESAIGFQTLDLLQWGRALSETDKLILRESIERQICTMLAEIIIIKSTDHDASSPAYAACHSIKQKLLADAIGMYLFYYMQSIRRQNAVDLLRTIGANLNIWNVKREDIAPQLRDAIPSPLLEAIEAAAGMEQQVSSSGPSQVGETNQWRDREFPDAINRAVSYIEALEGCRDRGRGRLGNDQGAEATFFLPGVVASELPCPKQLRPHEPLLGAITMLERLERFGFDPPDISSEPPAPPILQIVDRILPGHGAHCFNDPQGQKAIDKLTCGEPVPAVRPDFVRKVVAETVRAKLNDELDSTKVAKGIGAFFEETAIRGCELNACSLILVPSKPPEADECPPPEQQTAEDPRWCKLSRILAERTAAFSYAVTPTELVQRIGSEDASRMNLNAALDAVTQAGGPDLQAKLDSLYEFDDRIEMRHRHPVVVGFGSPNKDVREDDRRTVFGWVVRPRLAPKIDGDESRIRQVTQHYPLSAVVSVPSWWRSLKLIVRTAWIESDGDDDWIELTELAKVAKCAPEETDSRYRTCRVHFVRVPGSVKEISHKLKYEVREEPYIDSNAEPTALFEQVLQIGQPGEIILQGGRLWRSTVVTVGQQRADRIVVLPDMNGVIAEFTCVRPPQNGEQEQLVTVWTSEGSTRTPLRVRLRSAYPKQRCPENHLAP
jgi:hypothetical protein